MKPILFTEREAWLYLSGMFLSLAAAIELPTLNAGTDGLCSAKEVLRRRGLVSPEVRRRMQTKLVREAQKRRKRVGHYFFPLGQEGARARARLAARFAAEC